MTCRHPLRSVLMAAALLCATAPLAHADDASKHKKIEQLFTLIQIDKTLQQVASQQVAQVQTLIKKSFLGERMTADQQKVVNDFLAKILAITQGAMSWPKVEPQFVDLYASTYTEEEIDGIISFYRTPTGAAMIAKQPELLAKSQAISQSQLALVQPKLIAAVKQFAEEFSSKYPTAAH